MSVAQAAPRDYSISPPPVRYSPDGRTAVVSFTVNNQGGDAAESSLIIITENQSGRIETREILPPLAAGQAQSFSIELPLADYPDGDLFFKIEAGIDDYELAGSPIARDNTQLFRINKAAALEGAGGGRSPETSRPERSAFGIFIPIVNLGINFLDDGIQLNDNRYSSKQIIGALGLLAVALFCLWLLSLILRLIFRRPPKFDVWQPPYAANNWQAPNSALGRRQSWQFHAQNSIIAAPGAPEQATVVKRLLDKRGVVLGGWRIKAVRTVQYDVYGRINRTEVAMPHKIISMLNRVARRAPSYTSQELHKAMLPIARRLSKQALAPIEKQNLMLPIALEIRFEGMADDIRILFELYQYRDSAWQLIDQWEPELGQFGSHVPEQFSFTLNGQLPGESQSELKKRLREDVAQVLASLFYHHPVADNDNPVAGNAVSLNDLLQSPKEPWGASELDDETGPSSPPNR
jgi:hypothetical protein